MEEAIRSRVGLPTRGEGAQNESVFDILKLIFAGSPLPEVLTIIARLVESQGEGLLCTIWLPDEEGKYLYCAAAPSLPGFSAQVGPMAVCPKGASCGTAVYRKEPVYVTDILTDPIWDDYRDRVLPYGIRSAWSRPLFTNEDKVLGTFAILYREARSPATADLQLIENASHITGIAIERHMYEQALQRERDRLRLLLEITNSMTSKLDLRHLIEALSTNLLSVTRCDFCALLLPNADSGQLRVTMLYNPEARGSLCDGTLIPIHGSSCDKAFRTGKTQHFQSYEEVRDDPEYFGSSVGRPFYQRVMAEGLVSGCDLPLIGRSGVVGVLAALKRSERAYSKDDVAFLEQVASQVAIAVENALDYEKAIKDRDKETKQRRYLEEMEEERERLRQELAHFAHLNRVSTMGELTASLAHEINQPLAAIVTNAKVCLRWLMRDVPNLEEAREAAKYIARDGKRAGDVISRIRALVRNTGSEKAPLDINQAIDEVVHLTEQETVRKGVVLRTELAGDLPFVPGDRVQLQQVLLNLIMNGMEAMSSLADGRRELLIYSRLHESNQVLVGVQDSGIGIEPENLKKIFDPFYTTKSQGMGMGLAICRSIVENHGGKLWASPNDGRGATFQFTLLPYQ
jgi:signal transduction histidine kinase